MARYEYGERNENHTSTTSRPAGTASRVGSASGRRVSTDGAVTPVSAARRASRYGTRSTPGYHSPPYWNELPW